MRIVREKRILYSLYIIMIIIINQIEYCCSKPLIPGVVGDHVKLVSLLLGLFQAITILVWRGLPPLHSYMTRFDIDLEDLCYSSAAEISTL